MAFETSHFAGPVAKLASVWWMSPYPSLAVKLACISFRDHAGFFILSKVDELLFFKVETILEMQRTDLPVSSTAQTPVLLR